MRLDQVNAATVSPLEQQPMLLAQTQETKGNLRPGLSDVLSGERQLSAGDQGSEVHDLQRELKDLRFGVSDVQPHIYGPSITEAVKGLQAAYRIEENGVFGQDTAEALNAARDPLSGKIPDGRINGARWGNPVVNVPVAGTEALRISGGFMEPFGHARKNYNSYVMRADNPGDYTRTPPDRPGAGRNIGIDYIPQGDNGGDKTDVNAWLGGRVTNVDIAPVFGREHPGLPQTAGGYGKRVTIQSDYTIPVKNNQGNMVERPVMMAYSHLNNFNVAKGDRVQAGDDFATMGGTGSRGYGSYGAHVDMRAYVEVDGRQVEVDPNLLMPQAAREFKAADPTGFEARTQELANTLGDRGEAEASMNQLLGDDPFAGVRADGVPADGNGQGGDFLDQVRAGRMVFRNGSFDEPGVGQVQQMLKDLDYDVTVDNDYGNVTETAVRQFQRDAGIADDGVVGKDTVSALEAALENRQQPEAPTTDPTPPTTDPTPPTPPTTDPTPTRDPLPLDAALSDIRNGEALLRNGDFDNAQVEQVQQMLADLGYDLGVDGDFGNGTERAVTQFQRDAGLGADGVVGKDTLGALEAAREANRPPIGAEDYTAAPKLDEVKGGSLLKPETQGDAVQQVQNLLNRAGIETPKHGYYDEPTRAAVEQFQEREGLIPPPGLEGVVGPTTLDHLEKVASPQAADGISQEGLDFIASWEGWFPNIYNDAAGHATVGYGHLIHHGPADGRASEQPFINGISREQGLELLNQDAQEAIEAVDRLVKVPLTQNQKDALVSFTFNLGGGALESSTLLKKLNQGQYDEVGSEMKRFVYADGQYLEGLARRRAAEAEMFHNGAYNNN